MKDLNIIIYNLWEKVYKELPRIPEIAFEEYPCLELSIFQTGVFCAVLMRKPLVQFLINCRL